MKKIRVGLALGGGGARGYSHIHAFHSFDSVGIQPSIISGTSIGGLMGVMYAAGYSANDIEKYTTKLVNNRFAIVREFQKSDYESRSKRKKSLFPIGKLNLEKIISVLLPDSFPQTFEELSIPVRLVATNYFKQRPEVFSSGYLLPALAASAAVPAIFEPVILNDQIYIDGTASNPVPFDIIADDAELIVGINITGLPKGEPGTSPNRREIVSSLTHIMQQSIVEANMHQYNPDILLRPDVEGIMIHEFGSVAEILQQTFAMRDELTNQLKNKLAEHQNEK